MTLSSRLHELLANEGLAPLRFQEIVNRLLATAVLMRDEGTVEQKLYDDARRLDPVLNDYFSLTGFRLIHNVQHEYFRLYAPGVSVPGHANDEYEPVPSLRARVSRDFVAAALALRFLYQHHLVTASTQLTIAGEVTIRLPELIWTLKVHLQRSLPETSVEREKLIRELRQHRLILTAPGFSLNDDDAVIAIRPMILSVVSEDAVSAALANALGPDQTLASEDDDEAR